MGKPNANNRAYHPGMKLGSGDRHRKNHTKNPNFRFDNSKDVETSLYVRPDSVMTKTAILEIEKECVRTVSTHTKIGKILKQRATGTPLKALTPKGKHVLVANIDDGVSMHYSTRKLDFVDDEEIKLDKNFTKSDPYKAVVKPVSTVKKQEVTLTRAGYERTKRELDANGGKRCMTQAQVMRAPGKSAAEAATGGYAKASGIFKPSVQVEAAHLISHESLGAKSMKESNLVYTTAGSNTMQMPIDNFIKRLAYRAKAGLPVTVSANLVPKSHIATDIHIQTKGFEWTLNPLNPIIPHKSSAQYVKICGEKRLAVLEDKENAENQSSRKKQRLK